MTSHPGDETQELSTANDHVATPPVQLAMGEMLLPLKNRSALTAYYLAIFSLIPGLGLILGPLAFVLGIQGICQATVCPQVRGGHHATFSVVLSLITTIFNWVILILLAVFLFLYAPPPPR